MFFPKKTKYKKQFKGNLVGQTIKGSKIKYGQYALKILKETRLTSEQIEATRRTIIRKMKRLGFLWIRTFPNTPITKKPNQNRMGKGKGPVSAWVATIKKGQILYEISGINLEDAKIILESSSKKLPVQTKFISK